tara:strand:- start:6360 stop:7334 length:975 start_codon:yes stop_codon:yes gene_type:complete
MKKNKNVLITGAEGFIGSHLTEFLLKKNFKVKALVYYNSFNNLGWLSKISHKNLKIISGDINDSFFCTKITKGIDIIYNLAALISIPYSYVAPEAFINTNIKGTFNICKSAKLNKVKRIVHVSSSEVYGTSKYDPIDEKHPLQPQSPYSATKIGSEAVAMSFFYSYNLPVTVVRPFNTFGPRQSMKAVIPTVVQQALAGSKIKLGDVTTKRNFNYIDNTCEGLFSVINTKKTIGEILNIGSSEVISIKELITKVSNIVKKDLTIFKELKRIRPLNSEVKKLSCNYNKLKKLTNYKPKISFNEGLKKTIEWSKKNKQTNTNTYNF